MLKQVAAPEFARAWASAKGQVSNNFREADVPPELSSNQPFLGRSGDRHFEAKFVRLAGLPFGSAFHLGRMQPIELVLVFADFGKLVVSLRWLLKTVIASACP